MTISFTSLEIFEIAEQIERNGQMFYAQAAEYAQDKSIAQFFSQLAEMEGNHQKTFAQMKQELKNSAENTTVFDPDNETAYYLAAMAASAGWEGKSAPKMKFTGNETPQQILKAAIEAEKASISYYLGLKEMTLDKQKVDAIIKEEMGHVITLQKQLENLK